MTYTIEIVNDDDFMGDEPLNIESFTDCGRSHMIYDTRPIYYKSLESAARGVFRREYGYKLDDLGETVESCYGFVGDPKYCEQEARECVKYLELCDKRKRLIRNRAPLANRATVLARS